MAGRGDHEAGAGPDRVAGPDPGGARQPGALEPGNAGPATAGGSELFATTDDPEATYRTCSAELVEALDRTVGGWVERSVRERQLAWAGAVAPTVEAAARDAGEAARAEVIAGVGRLVALDVEAQTTNPLSLLRAAVRHPTAVLAQAGVPEVVRDDFAERSFPADVYDLSPASFADVDPDLAEPGLRWGAAKALVVLSRRRRRP
jgi:hypothetical protein